MPAAVPATAVILFVLIGLPHMRPACWSFHLWRPDAFHLSVYITSAYLRAALVRPVLLRYVPTPTVVIKGPLRGKLLAADGVSYARIRCIERLVQQASIEEPVRYLCLAIRPADIVQE